MTWTKSLVIPKVFIPTSFYCVHPDWVHTQGPLSCALVQLRYSWLGDQNEHEMLQNAERPDWSAILQWVIVFHIRRTNESVLTQYLYLQLHVMWSACSIRFTWARQLFACVCVCVCRTPPTGLLHERLIKVKHCYIARRRVLQEENRRRRRIHLGCLSPPDLKR